MHHVAIVIYPGFELLDATGPASVFNVANRTLAQRGAASFYEIVLVSAKCGAVKSSSGVALETRPIAGLQPAEAQTLLIAGAEGEHLAPALADPTLLTAIPRLACECRTIWFCLQWRILPRCARANRWPSRRDALGRHRSARQTLSKRLRRSRRTVRSRWTALDISWRNLRH